MPSDRKKSSPEKPKQQQKAAVVKAKPQLMVEADGLLFEPLAVTGAVAAALLSVSDKTLYTMRQRGQIRAVPIDPDSTSAQLRYPMSEIQRFLAGAE